MSSAVFLTQKLRVFMFNLLSMLDTGLLLSLLPSFVVSLVSISPCSVRESLTVCTVKNSNKHGWLEDIFKMPDSGMSCCLLSSLSLASLSCLSFRSLILRASTSWKYSALLSLLSHRLHCLIWEEVSLLRCRRRVFLLIQFGFPVVGGVGLYRRGGLSKYPVRIRSVWTISHKRRSKSYFKHF